MLHTDHLCLRKAIQKGGKVKATISKVVVQGPALVGKTAVKCLVLAQQYKSKGSTGIVERPLLAVGTLDQSTTIDIQSVEAVGHFSVQQFGQGSKKKWELVNDDDIIEMFANDIKSEMESDQNVGGHKTQLNEVQHVIEIAPGNGGKNEHGNDTQHQTNPQSGNVTSSVPSIALLDPSSQTSLIQPIEESNKAVEQLSEILGKAARRADKLTLYKDWLFFIDSGGQIQFQQILQAFIPCASALMLVISLADNLSTQSSNYIQCEDGKKYIVSEHSLSIETLLKRLISMVNFSNQQEDVTSSDNCLAAAIKPPEKLKIITIATHRDKYDELIQNGEVRETIEEKEAQLKQIFQSVQGNLSYENPVSGKIISEVDGRKAHDPEEMHDDNLKKVIEEIRDELSNQAFKVEIPLRWYAYEILLRHKARDSCGVLPLEECISSGVELGLEEEEIHSALKFLYLLNSILYYPEKCLSLFSLTLLALFK